MEQLAGHNIIKAPVYNEIFNSLETAVIYYDENGCLAGANDMSWTVLPDLRSRLPYFSDFLRFVYDHSLDMADQGGLKLTLKPQTNDKVFYEVITIGEGNVYLVRAVEQRNQAMIIELSNISPIKKYTDDLRQLDNSNKILTEAIQASDKGIFIAENYGEKRILFANKALDRLLEREGAPLVGYSSAALLSSQFVEDWDKIDNVLFSRSKGSFWKKICRDGQDSKWLLLNLSAESECDGRNLIIGFVSDDTQNKLQENHLRQTQKLEAIGKLAGGVAHDFNNILSIVEGYIRLSESAIKRGEDVTANFLRIKQAVARGSGLTKQLLMFGKHRVTDNKIIDVCAQVRDMETLLYPLLGADISLHIEAPDSVLPVKATEDIISQIIMNLVINARDAMVDGGQINVSLYPDSTDGRAQAVLKVIDSGCGMPPEIMEKIFDPFFTTKEQGKGTGLGLSMVYGLVQQIGATIHVSSVVDEGTTFTIVLPIIEGVDLTGMAKQSAKPTTSVSGKTILIAEDEPDLLEIMEYTLKDFDMHVLKAKNGNEALQVQDDYDGKIDFLLTDMVMPELGGLKLAELMKEVRPDTHIVFMSGYPVRGEIASVNLPRDAIFMAKPVKPDYLRNVLEQISMGQPVKQTDATMWQA